MKNTLAIYSIKLTHAKLDLPFGRLTKALSAVKLSLCLTLTLLDQDVDCATRMAAQVICYGLLFLAIAWYLLGNLALLSKTGHISRSTIPCPVQLNASAGIAGASFATTHISTLDSLDNDDELALLRRQLNEALRR